LFSLPDKFRFNFALIAGAPIAGRTHTPETLAQMSDSKSGANNPMFGKSHSDDTRAKMSEAQTGANHPMFGKVAANAMTVNVYSLDNVLVRSFSSKVACAKWLGVSEGSVRNYLRSGKVFKGLYQLSNFLTFLIYPLLGRFRLVRMGRSFKTGV